jgi:hypothetical protein
MMVTTQHHIILSNTIAINQVLDLLSYCCLLFGADHTTQKNKLKNKNITSFIKSIYSTKNKYSQHYYITILN